MNEKQQRKTKHGKPNGMKIMRIKFICEFWMAIIEWIHNDDDNDVNRGLSKEKSSDESEFRWEIR